MVRDCFHHFFLSVDCVVYCIIVNEVYVHESCYASRIFFSTLSCFIWQKSLHHTLWSYINEFENIMICFILIRNNQRYNVGSSDKKNEIQNFKEVRSYTNDNARHRFPLAVHTRLDVAQRLHATSVRPRRRPPPIGRRLRQQPPR